MLNHCFICLLVPVPYLESFPNLNYNVITIEPLYAGIVDKHWD